MSKARYAQLEALTKSLREYGFVQPVLARQEDKAVIGGHQRLSIDPNWVLVRIRSVARLDQIRSELAESGEDFVSEDAAVDPSCAVRTLSRLPAHQLTAPVLV